MKTLVKETETTLVKINASDYGLDSVKAQEIEAMFTPMLNRMKELEKEYNQVLKLKMSPETCQIAKELRLQYVKVRTGTAEIHKQLKDFYLKGGRFVDGWKNAQLFASNEIEETLKNIENHYEIIEAEKKAKLKEERTALIMPYVSDVNTFMLGEMTEEAFNILLAGAKFQYEMKIAAEKKAEEDRLSKEKTDAEEREKQRLENIRLKAEAKEREWLAEIERKRQASILAEQKAEADKREKALKEKADAERKERERLEAEMAVKKEADEKARKDAEAKIAAENKARLIAEKKARLAPDKTKLLVFMQAINDLPRPEVKSIEAADIVSKANIMLVQVANYVKDNAIKL